MAVFDQDAPAAILMKYPSLYEHGRLDLAYKGKFWPMMLDALYGGTVVFFFTYAAYLLVGMMEEKVGGIFFFWLSLFQFSNIGLDDDIVEFGIDQFYALVFAVTAVAMLITRTYTWLNWVALAWRYVGMEETWI